MGDQETSAGESGPTRRKFMIGGGAALGGMAIGGAGSAGYPRRAGPTARPARLVDDAQAAAPGEHRANRDPLQPGRKETPLLEAPERAPGGNERLLGAILGGLPLTGEPQA